MKKEILRITILVTISCWIQHAAKTQTIIGGSDRDPSAILELRSNDKGLLLPRLSIQERDAISNPATGLLIYNVTLQSVEVNTGSAGSPSWQQLSAAGKCGAYVAAGVWKEFMCHNLGANTTADPFTPSWELIGHYYQWGRNPTCFGRDDMDDTNPCTEPVYGAAAPWGNNQSNDNTGSISGWNTVPAPDGAWLDNVKTANDPCPSGFRVPTIADWDGVINNNPVISQGTWTGSSNYYDSGKKFGNNLFLPSTGGRTNDTGLHNYKNERGHYMSSTLHSSSNMWFLLFTQNLLLTSNNFGFRTSGISIRCIKE